MRTWTTNHDPHTAFMSNDDYFGRWSSRNDRYNLYEPVNGDIVCMVDRKELVRYCQENDLNCFTYLLYIFERHIDKYNKAVDYCRRINKNV